jgi:NitT/TauT family transport system ATP-binding protein
VRVFLLFDKHHITNLWITPLLLTTRCTSNLIEPVEIKRIFNITPQQQPKLFSHVVNTKSTIAYRMMRLQVLLSQGEMITMQDTPTQSNNTDAQVRLSFDSISMTFPDGTTALEDVSFNVSAGEFVTVVGPSGCGKSTLLRIASGLTANTSGNCAVNRESLGYVFQDATLLPWRNVQRNVELNAELQGMSKSDRRAKAQDAIELVGLTGHETKYPKQLSGGMKMRTSLARALVLKPSVFMFDEPFGALDEITRERLQDELLSLFVHEGFAGLFITHSIPEAVFLSTRVLCMSARPGRIIGDFSIPWEYPRNHDLRYSPEFAEMCGQVSQALKDAHS